MNLKPFGRNIFVLLNTALISSALFFVLIFHSPLAAQTPRQKIVVLGDSLVAGYELKAGEGFPEQLQQKMDPQKSRVEFINAGVSGDTTSAGLARLDWSVGDDVNGVILELGANDALRGISPDTTQKNLQTMIEKLQARNVSVMLVGMMAPPNMGKDYGDRFNAIYPQLAKQYGLEFYPFFLDGVAAEPGLNLSDGMHPNPEGVRKIVEKIEPFVEKFLQKLQN